jgi:hypothetical protein
MVSVTQALGRFGKCIASKSRGGNCGAARNSSCFGDYGLTLPRDLNSIRIGLLCEKSSFGS